MPRPLPPNAAALRAQAEERPPGGFGHGAEPDPNPVELAFELADDMSASLQVIALALSGLFTIEAARARAEFSSGEPLLSETTIAEENARLRAQLGSIATQLAQAMQPDDNDPEPPSAGGTDPT